MPTDSVATWFDSFGGKEHFRMKKLLRLGSHAAMVSAGAGIGSEMARSFQRFVHERKLDGIEEILRLGFPFFTGEYGSYLKEKRGLACSEGGATEKTSIEDAPLTGIYLIVAGYSFRDRDRPYQLRLVGNDEEGQCMREYPDSPILVVPRSLSMERRLAAQREGGALPDQILSLFESFLRKRSAEEEEVGLPFHFATITAAGVKEMTREE